MMVSNISSPTGINGLYTQENVSIIESVYNNGFNDEGHIMMVSSITKPDGYDTDGKPYWNDGSGVTVIESVFSNLFVNYGATNKRNLTELKSKANDPVTPYQIWRQNLR